MKINLLWILLFLASFSCAARAQEMYDGRTLSSVKADFNLVKMVAHVKINKIELAAPQIHPLYKVEGDLLEMFKGTAPKAKTFTFYFSAEDDYNVNKLVGKEWIVFLEKQIENPAGEKVWYELENSKITPSKKLTAHLRKMKTSAKKR